MRADVAPRKKIDDAKVDKRIKKENIPYSSIEKCKVYKGKTIKPTMASNALPNP